MSKREILKQYITVEDYLKDTIQVIEMSKKGPVLVVDECGKVRLSVSQGYEPSYPRRSIRHARKA